MDYAKFKKYQDVVYNTVYSEGDTGFHIGLIEQVVNMYFTPMHLPKDALILDLGCGQGKFMEEVTKLGYNNLVGYTLSKEDVEACQTKGFRVYERDFSDIDMEDGVVDLIWCRHCLEHSPFPVFSLLEFHRVLKKGGLAYIEVPAPDCERVHETNANHFSILGSTMWTALFDRTGFLLRHGAGRKFRVDLKSGDHFEEHYLFFFIQQK